MRALLFVAEALLAEGGDFLRPGVARQPDPAARLARRLLVLSFALRSLAACLEHRRNGADRRVVERCLAHVRHDLAIVARLLPTLTEEPTLLRLAALRHAGRPPSLPIACRRVQTEMQIVAALARSADQSAFSRWAQRRAQHYLRRGLAGASMTRTRSRGTSPRTRSASAVNAAMRG